MDYENYASWEAYPVSHWSPGALTYPWKLAIMDYYPMDYEKFNCILHPAFDQIRVTRAAHAVISLNICLAIVQAHVRRANNPSLSSYKFSLSWMKDALKYELDFSFRCTTRAAQKIPAEWEKYCLQAHARAVYTIKIHDIPHPDFIVNEDQTGVGLMPSGKKTWAKRGSKQVEGHGHDEKRQVCLHTLTIHGSFACR